MEVPPPPGTGPPLDELRKCLRPTSCYNIVNGELQLDLNQYGSKEITKLREYKTRGNGTFSGVGAARAYIKTKGFQIIETLKRGV